jgi:biopolymer transport protein ExbB/TolQ
MLGSLFSRITKSPLLWGGLASFAFYTMIHNKVVTNATILRYTSMHPVEYAITIMFFVGMASVCLKFFDVRQHWSRLKFGTGLESIGERKLESLEAVRLIAQIDEHVQQYGKSLHGNRLRLILNNMSHSGTSERLDDDLRCMADDDFVRAEGDYGLVKIIIWAIPILGFLGTVIGIALAMGNLAPDALEESLPLVMGGLTIAFDTTALALALSMIIYFTQFATWRDEQKLLDEVSQLVDWELRGRFVSRAAVGEGSQLVSVRMMIEVVLETLQDLIQKQADIWDQAISASHSRYAMMASESATQMKTTLALAMRENVETHAQALAKAEQELMQSSKRQVQEMAKTIHESVAALGEFQAGMVHQSEVLREIINATGDIAKLESQLNKNLSSLAEARYFEETLNSLAAAIHLLSSKQVAQPIVETVMVTRGKGKGQAA